MSNRTKPCGIVSFTTDFGLNDPFVGLLHAVSLRVDPALRLVDLTHGIAPQDVQEAAFWLAKSYGYFSKGTVHVVVVDPGVGTSREPICVYADGHYFVGPNNGIITSVIGPGISADARIIDVDRYCSGRPSNTFHGRDIFAPIAALIASGQIRFDDVGKPITILQNQSLKEANFSTNHITGQIVTIDRFGNMITNIPGLVHATDASSWAGGRQIRGVTFGKVKIRMVQTYGNAAPDEIVALRNSFDVIEVAQRDGHAANYLKAKKGDVVIGHF